MTTSHLPRRAVVGAVLAASIVGGGLVAAFADDTAQGPCPSWTDPKGDATTGQVPAAPLSDDQMDIVSASLTNDGANVVATIGDVKMGTTASDFGDEFHINFTIGGKALQAYADRGPSAGPATSPVGFSAGFYNITDDVTGKATAKYDTKANTVTITGPVAELSKALGADAAGKVASAIAAETQDYAPGAGTGFIYDQAATKATFTVGADCGGGALVAPGAAASASASASPSPSAPAPAAPAPSGAGDPSKLPNVDCFLAKDPKGDGHVVNANVPNDPDLDITGLTIGSDATTMYSYIKVDKLGAGPSSSTDGHRYYLNFTFNKHAFTAAGSAYKNASSGQVRDGLANSGQISHVTQLSMDGSTGTPGYVASTLKFVFDQKNSVVIISIPLADLEKAAKAPTAGAVFTGVYAGSYADTDALAEGADFLPDGATATAPGKLTYTVGDSSCFGAATPASAAASALTNTGATKAQYGDSAAVAAKLVDASGAPAAGKDVTFSLGSSTATGTTGADGVAKAALPVKDKAGKRSLVLTSGDAKTVVEFTVLVEKTTLKATGSKGSVTATLTDDDKSPVAGQVITFTSGSKKVSVKTDAKGVAKAKGLPAGNVKVSYAGVPGMYSAATTSTKA